ncbi:hypothetical protein HK17_15265 [Acetobacter indonesiensis]|uniref:Uncharacterized protein n=1 Tax=Acetobacter indonesiensis TaxID=104101 RepID=A0A252AJS0_9PROT|nr:hypothetical protein [Acetobacter indonesiensis]OUI89892.1 hypothetical protein HK17_15265 [Acetobacter indonesiensis]
MWVALVSMPNDRRQLGAIARLKPFQGVSLPALIIPPFPMEGGYQRQKRVLVLPDGAQASRGLDTDRGSPLIMLRTHFRRMGTVQDSGWAGLCNMVAGPWLAGGFSENKGDRPAPVYQACGRRFRGG